MRTPTAEQQAVLDSPARVRVVRSAPGSGKTWLVAELIRQELDKWPTKTSGIAALSFTRVGGDEIRKAVGYELGHPHFVGTIDAFLFRYVVRPFLNRCFPNLATPRLIPGEWGAEHWTKYPRNEQTTIGARINLFDCVFIDEVNGNAVIAYKPHPASSLRLLDDKEEIVEDGKKVKLVKAVKDAMMRRWERSGLLTHSDAALWASKILGHPTLGAVVRAELIRRFSLIIVDELQDAGFFLGKSIRLLLEESAAQGVLVGDPDQAIYEFNGARPDLFRCFETIVGAVTLPLSNSQRCASAITAAASHLKDSGGSVGPAHDKVGRAFMVRYSNMTADISRIVDAVTTAHKCASVKVIARHTATVEALVGRNDKVAPKLGCPPLNHMQQAVVEFRQGRQVAALAAARAAIDLVVFEREGMEDAKLEEHGIDPSQWKRLAVECLLRASVVTATGNLYDWQTEVSRIFDEKLGGFGLAPSLQIAPGKLKPEKLKDRWDKPCGDYLPTVRVSAVGASDVPVKTVHGVKGETHDVTILVCPDAKRADHCPSTVWWSGNEKDREERRIAYVAMTRTQGDLIVCVSDDCFRRLSASRKPFVDSFECLTIDEYAAMPQPDAVVQDATAP